MTLTSNTLPYDVLRYAIGAESLFDRVTATSSWHHDSTNYPPYNIIKINKYLWKVEVALSGFSEQDVEVEIHDGILEVRSSANYNNEGWKNENNEKQYSFKGIAKRKFIRKFALGEDVVVKNALMENGLLTIDLEQIIPEEKKPRLIPINNAKLLEHVEEAETV